VNDILSNPRALLALLCVAGLVLGVNALLFAGLRGKGFTDYAAKWGQAFGGGAEARKRQRDQADELHRRVEQLQAAKPDLDEKDS
jgi:hypothetical protein